MAVEWFRHRLAEALLEIDDLMSKYRISEAMTVAYKLYRDDFSAFYLEAIKPPFGAPMDAQTLAATRHYLEVLLQTLHPFMPFITEELWQDMAPRKAGETIMYTRMPKLEEPNKELLSTVAAAREVITQVRNVRTTHNIARAESLTLQCGKGHPAMADCLITKLVGATCTPLASSTEGGSSATFIVGTVSYAIPIDSYIDKGALREKLEADLKHQQGFLMGVRKKLSNERFVSGAPQAVVDLERKKEADALARIATLEKQLKDLE